MNLIDHLGPDVSSAFYMKEQVFHRARAHLIKSTGNSVIFQCAANKKVAYVFDTFE